MLKILMIISRNYYILDVTVRQARVYIFDYNSIGHKPGLPQPTLSSDIHTFL